MCGFCAVNIKAPEDDEEEDDSQRLPPEIKQVHRASPNTVRGSEGESNPAADESKILNASNDLWTTYTLKIFTLLHTYNLLFKSKNNISFPQTVI